MEPGLHAEFDCRVTAKRPWGVEVDLCGRKGMVDNAKLPAWWRDAPLPEVGEVLHVVVIDELRTPPRLSALPADLETARKLRLGDGTS